MHVLIYTNDYLMLQSLRRMNKRAGYTCVAHYVKLPAREQLPAANKLDLLVLHHEPARYGGSVKSINNLYLAELAYPDLPILVISGSSNQLVRQAFRQRPHLRQLPLLFSPERFKNTVSALMTSTRNIEIR